MRWRGWWARTMGRDCVLDWGGEGGCSAPFSSTPGGPSSGTARTEVDRVLSPQSQSPVPSPPVLLWPESRLRLTSLLLAPLCVTTPKSKKKNTAVKRAPEGSERPLTAPIWASERLDSEASMLASMEEAVELRRLACSPWWSAACPRYSQHRLVTRQRDQRPQAASGGCPARHKRSKAPST